MGYWWRTKMITFKHIVNILYLCLVSLCAYFIYVLLLFPMAGLSNRFYQANKFWGNIFIESNDYLTLFFVFFFSSIFLVRFKFYSLSMALFYGSFSVLLILVLTRTESSSDSYSSAISYLTSLIPLLSVMLAWFLKRSRKGQEEESA